MCVCAVPTCVNVCLYVWVWTHMWVYLYECTCVCVHMEPQGWCQISFSSYSLHYLLRQGLFLTPELLNPASPNIQFALGSLYLFLPSAGTVCCAGSIGGCSPSGQGSQVWSPPLRGKCFIHRAIIPAPLNLPWLLGSEWLIVLWFCGTHHCLGCRSAPECPFAISGILGVSLKWSLC